MRYDEAIAEIAKDNKKSMWRKDWQTDGTEKFVMYFDCATTKPYCGCPTIYKVKPYFAKFVNGETAELCWTPTLIDASADDWVVTDEY